MKFKKVSGKSLGDNAPIVLGAVGGAMVGRGLTAVITKPAGATPTQDELNKKMYVQLAMSVAGFVGYSVVDGNDAVANATKGAAIGIAIDNGLAVIATLAGKSTALTTKLAADTPINRFAKSALGLGCPGCDGIAVNTAMNRPRRRAMLRYPVVDTEALAVTEFPL